MSSKNNRLRRPTRGKHKGKLWLVCSHVRGGYAGEVWCRPDRVAVCPACAKRGVLADIIKSGPDALAMLTGGDHAGLLSEWAKSAPVLVEGFERNPELLTELAELVKDDPAFADMEQFSRDPSLMCAACLSAKLRGSAALIHGREHLERDGVLGHAGHN
jgi:hypothetical protein